ncbi:comF family protein [Filimonas lacunae]|uniref:ComF family protein n=1 Tax=Filimonas lacunae TaxID=477680 RepID=A0A173MR06_9BACT|nr:ComF family protein [Filimonas lacunae]BAV10105.1 phosphoribosyltransferase [Filimonas lacunae]SIS84075.1 comF family protein [Filimonas lacunae]
MKRYITSLLHLFYPHNCAGCGSDVLAPDIPVCASCHSQLPATSFMGIEGNPVEKLFYGRVRIAAAGSLFYFTRQSAVQRILFQLKYERNQQTGLWLGKQLGQQLKSSGRFAHVTAIIPVPLHHRKQKQRGYNQSQLIAEGISSVCKWPVITKALQRSVFTSTQTHQNRENRLLNLQNAFSVHPQHLLSHTHVLLVDDVITTGATLEACALALQQQKITVSIATIASTLLS